MNPMIGPILDGPIRAALGLLPLKMDSNQARAMLIKIGICESELKARRQIVNGKPIGPAAGLWQFERGGIIGVMRHRLTNKHLRDLCKVMGTPFDLETIWQDIQTDDILAAGLARLNLYWYHMALPAASDEQGSYDQYIAIWRPGKPSRTRWANAQKDLNQFMAARSLQSLQCAAPAH